MRQAASLGRVLELLAMRPPAGADVAERREGYENLARRMGGAARAQMRPDTIANVPGEWHMPENARPDVRIEYLHGGAFALGSPATYRAMAGKLAELTGIAVFVPHYRRIPEHPFPAGLDDCVAVARTLQSDAALAIVGDSAGGNLTLATALRLRPRLPAALAVISPWLDLTQSAPSYAERAAVDPFIVKAALDWASAAYLGDRARNDPFAAPIHGDFSGFPPVWIGIGTCEVLFDDSRRLHERLTAQGVRTELVVGEGMIHVWPFFWPVLPEGLATLASIAAFLRGATRA